MAVRKKQEPFNLGKELRKFDNEHPVIGERWMVVEVTPAWTDSGYWGEVSYPEKSIRVSNFFNTEEEAASWMDKYESDGSHGAYLKVTSEKIRAGINDDIHWRTRNA